MVSSRATCINRISAPHARQRIPPIHSFLFVTSAAHRATRAVKLSRYYSRIAGLMGKAAWSARMQGRAAVTIVRR